MSLKASEVFAIEIPGSTATLSRNVGGKNYRRTGNLTLRSSGGFTQDTVNFTEITGDFRLDVQGQNAEASVARVGGKATLFILDYVDIANQPMNGANGTLFVGDCATAEVAVEGPFGGAPNGSFSCNKTGTLPLSVSGYGGGTCNITLPNVSILQLTSIAYYEGMVFNFNLGTCAIQGSLTVHSDYTDTAIIATSLDLSAFNFDSLNWDATLSVTGLVTAAPNSLAVGSGSSTTIDFTSENTQAINSAILVALQTGASPGIGALVILAGATPVGAGIVAAEALLLDGWTFNVAPYNTMTISGAGTTAVNRVFAWFALDGFGLMEYDDVDNVGYRIAGGPGAWEINLNGTDIYYTSTDMVDSPHLVTNWVLGPDGTAGAMPTVTLTPALP